MCVDPMLLRVCRWDQHDLPALSDSSLFKGSRTPFWLKFPSSDFLKVSFQIWEKKNVMNSRRQSTATWKSWHTSFEVRKNILLHRGGIFQSPKLTIRHVISNALGPPVLIVESHSGIEVSVRESWEESLLRGVLHGSWSQPHGLTHSPAHCTKSSLVNKMERCYKPPSRDRREPEIPGNLK